MRNALLPVEVILGVEAAAAATNASRAALCVTAFAGVGGPDQIMPKMDWLLRSLFHMLSAFDLIKTSYSSSNEACCRIRRFRMKAPLNISLVLSQLFGSHGSWSTPFVSASRAIAADAMSL